jgi:HrpA-like RNA helicase
VIATNAAESSVTIPDVDHVICLGASKVLTYNARQHTTQLVNSWCVLF